jgi:hypothetical protein
MAVRRTEARIVHLPHCLSNGIGRAGTRVEAGAETGKMATRFLVIPFLAARIDSRH